MSPSKVREGGWGAIINKVGEGSRRSRRSCLKSGVMTREARHLPGTLWHTIMSGPSVAEGTGKCSIDFSATRFIGARA